MAAAFMQLWRHGWDNHVVAASADRPECGNGGASVIKVGFLKILAL